MKTNAPIEKTIERNPNGDTSNRTADKKKETNGSSNTDKHCSSFECEQVDKGVFSFWFRSVSGRECAAARHLRQQLESKLAGGGTVGDLLERGNEMLE